MERNVDIRMADFVKRVGKPLMLTGEGTVAKHRVIASADMRWGQGVTQGLIVRC